MARFWKSAPIKPAKQMIVTKATCDRCGRIATLMNTTRYAWGFAEVAIQGQGFYFADLCADCSALLKEWIDSGSGSGMVDEITRANEPVYNIEEDA